jgi:putative transposase
MVRRRARVRELKRKAVKRAIPRMIVRDNGCELTSSAVLRSSFTRVEWHYIAPGKPA